MFILFRIIVISFQVSSLIRRLILVPSRIVLIFILNIVFSFSGLLSYIFIIIFIGGLIVLLVRVTSIIPQEQGVSFRLLIFIMSLIIMVVFLTRIFIDWFKGRDSRESYFRPILFLDFIKVSFRRRTLAILVICLFILTKVLLEFKGLTRNL